MTVKEVELAISKFSSAELEEFLEWFDHFREENWDREIERDLQSRRLDSLIREAEADYRDGRTKPL
jgi:hypothetical protein